MDLFMIVIVSAVACRFLEAHFSPTEKLAICGL